MTYAAVIAWRYITANKSQSILLIAGVSLSVVVFVFITALISGLQASLVEQVTGSQSHVTLEPAPRVARVLVPQKAFAARPVSTFQRAQLPSGPQTVAYLENLPGIARVSPQITGNAFLVRGEAVQPVLVEGVELELLDAITPLSDRVIEGSADLSSGGLLVGARLAEDLGVRAGQPVLLRTERGVERSLPVAGIFESGIGSLDERVAFIGIAPARALFDLPNGLSRVETKLFDPLDAPRIAASIEAATGLDATTWQENNREIETAIAGQGRSALLIQVFALVSIAVGVASALLLSTVRRRAEIGIMRSFGISKSFVGLIFILQGGVIGFVGALLGSGIGYLLCARIFSTLDPNGDPVLPADPTLGGYGIVIPATVCVSVIAALLPARSAASLDPVEAIAS